MLSMMQSNMVKKWLGRESGTGLMSALIWAKLLDKLCRGLISILSPADKAMLKIRSAVSVTQYRTEATIERIKIKQLEKASPIGQATTFPLHSGNSSNINIGTFVPNNNIQFNAGNKPVLIITAEGDVVWRGKPSEAANTLKKSFTFAVEDINGITEAARRRYYLLACQNLLRVSEDMEYEEFLAFLNKEVYNRERRVIIDSLKGEQQ